ncbi:MAG: Mfa1 family fimbria major subunit [Muribaculaceae bacterium]|nr:Mfa1 family fimbria major subunit [Muribaculaceae bacterium]
MKHLGKLTFGLLAMLMASCSSEEPLTPDSGDQSNPSGKDVYASLSLRLPGATRSLTRAEGDEDANYNEEFGQNYENSVGKVFVVLATKNDAGQYLYLTSAESDAKPNYTDVPANTVKYVLNFSSDDMTPDPLDKNKPGSDIPSTPTKQDDVYVFVYCNPSTTLLKRFEEVTTGVPFTDIVGTIEHKDNALMWQANNFLMTNNRIVKAANPIPSREELINKHGTPETAFPLGTVEVKRAAARFDFMSTTTSAGLNKYSIKDLDGTTEVGVVELTEMAMFNIAKNFHYLPRTSSTWDWDDKNITLCSGAEESEYVVSYNINKFKQSTPLNNYAGYYFSNLIGNSLSSSSSSQGTNSLNWTKLSDFSGMPADNPAWEPDQDSKTDYRIWRYATENTIPAASSGQSTSSQKVGITTGVVFKGIFTPTTEASKGRWNGNAVYVHNNVVFGDFATLKAYVQKYPNSVVAADFEAVDAFHAENVDLKKSLLKGVSGDEAHGFKCYEPDVNGQYAMYYFYYNRHKSNGKPSVMGHDEFGVVRNNVYKLKVTKCGTFGEPSAPNRPDDPDEEENAYFTVSCIVLPWSVKVNNIEF